MGGADRFHEPEDYEVFLPGLHLGDFFVTGHTWTRDGLRLVLFHKGEPVSQHWYDYHQYGPLYFPRMSRDIAEDINFLLECEGVSERVESGDLRSVMEVVLGKCESRYGNPVPDSEYEAKITFVE